MSLVFLKGYQWPFDIRKALDGSSLIDLLVYRETVLRGRRVFLDFRRNPVQPEFDPSALSPEAYEYLDRAGVLFGTPIERLRRMNEPAYQFYLGKNPYVDLETTMLEVDVCAQHNNGGLVVDAWWQSNIDGLLPGRRGRRRARGLPARRRGAEQRAGGRDAGGAVHRGTARLRAAAVRGRRVRCSTPLSRSSSRPSARAASGIPDNTGDLLREVQVLMSAKAGPVRSAQSIDEALVQVHEWLSTYESTVSADASSRRSINRTFLVRDILTSAYVYLSAMADYVAHGGRSRGSVLYTDPAGTIPHGLTGAARRVPVHPGRRRARRRGAGDVLGPGARLAARRTPGRRRPRRRARVPLAPAPAHPRGRRLLRERLAGVPRAREHPLMRLALPDPRVEIRGAGPRGGRRADRLPGTSLPHRRAPPRRSR